MKLLLKKRFKCIFHCFLTFCLLSNTFLVSATADSSSTSCILKASPNNDVSLGLPVATERLSSKNSVKIGVLPFQFTDGTAHILTENDKKDYLDAAKIIENLSNNQVKIDFIFFTPINSGYKSSELKDIYLKRDQSWQTRNLTISTWGFVKNTILTADKNTDFKGVDSVILEGNNLDTSYYINEAMLFFGKNSNSNFNLSNDDFYQHVQTNEGSINNAILLDNHVNPNLIAHEIMHNFGLTDLYGTGTGPAYLSLMAGTSAHLLNYEKVIMGWFPNKNLTCQDFNSFIKQPIEKLEINFNNINEDSIIILKISEETAYIFEIVHEGKSAFLLSYFIDNEGRPPITMFLNPNVPYFNVYDLNDVKNVGNFYNSPEFRIFITNRINDSVTINLIPIAFLNSTQVDSIIKNSLSRREILINQAVADAKAKSEADAKAKAEADSTTKTKIVVPKTTITCIKGKTLKKVTAINPKCPAGYKKK